MKSVPKLRKNSEDERNMKAMLKSELAREAGVSVRTFNRWCKPYHKELVKMGWKPRMKLLSPKIVAYLTDKFCI